MFKSKSMSKSPSAPVSPYDTPPPVHHHGGGDGGVEGLGGVAALGGGGNGDTVGDSACHFCAYAVRFVADDQNVIAVEFELADIFTIEEGAEDTAVGAFLFQKLRK